MIFREHWWLDAVAPGNWQEVEIERNGEVVASMPFVLRGLPCGFVVLGPPPLCPRLGPEIRAGEGKYVTRLGREMEYVTELIDALPEYHYFQQNFAESFTNWLPFYWRGFTQTTQYSYVIEDTRDPDTLWNGLASNTRKNLRKADRRVGVETAEDPDILIEMVQATFERQSQKMRQSPAVVRRAAQTAIERDRGEILCARDDDGALHAATFCVWDDTTAYYLLGGGDPEHRSSAAHIKLLWTAIEHATERGLRFDFEGSMIEPIERIFRSFGAHQHPYSRIIGFSRRGRVAYHAREIVHALRRPGAGRS